MVMGQMESQSRSTECPLKVNTLRFGILELEERHLLSFPWGLPGLEDCHQFVLLEPHNTRPICWLQSIEYGEIALPCIEPWTLAPKYEVVLSTADSAALELVDSGDAAVLVILNLAKPPEDRTANLIAPVVINIERRIGRQILMEKSPYGLREPLAKLLGSQLSAVEVH
jgi:flagellar assembly factor FliW